MLRLLLLTATAYALRVPTPTRRQLLSGAGLAAASRALPVNALVNPFSLEAAAGPRGLLKSGDIAVPKGPGNSGILLLREFFDGQTPDQGRQAWLEEHLAADFQASFAGGKVVQSKEEFIAGCNDLLKSFPDLAFTREGPIAYNNSPNLVVWTAIVKGTHTGAAYSPKPGAKAMPSKGVAVQNDPEKVVATFAPGTGLSKLLKLTVDPLEGGKGFSGPVGFYLQVGGSASDL